MRGHSGRSLEYLAGFDGSLPGKNRNLKDHGLHGYRGYGKIQKTEKNEASEGRPESGACGIHLCFPRYLLFEKKRFGADQADQRD
jgi:hypothetical protein